MKPGIYQGMPLREYLAIEAVSAGLLHEIDSRCPRAAWFCSWLNPKRPLDDSNAAQGKGTAAHQALLEGSTDCIEIIYPHRYPNDGGGVPKGWTNPKIRAARDESRRAGRVPMLPGEDEPVRAMVDAARAYLEGLAKTQPAIHALFQPDGGESEVVIVWQERDGTLCKIRPDRISLDRRLTVNFKTTLASAEPESWFRRQASAMGYPLASAFYRRGIEQALRVEADEVWLVQEQDPPHLCSLVGLDPMGLHAAQMRMMRALRTWSACAKVGRWPGYASDVSYVETPPWDLAKAEEPSAHGIEQDPDLVAREHVIARESEQERWARNLAAENAPPV